MLKKTIEFVDYNDNKRTEDHYFHLNDAEIMEMQLGVNGGLTAFIENIVAAQDIPSLIKIFKELILKAYGQKSPDGREFIKSEELSKSFSQTEAYSKLFMELATNDIAAAEFIKGIVPADLAKKAEPEIAKALESRLSE